jgi:hypothetical protein
MAPSEYFVRLQRGANIRFIPIFERRAHDGPVAHTGIAGGFAPPTPSAVYQLSLASNQSSLQVLSSTRPPGTPALQDAAPKSLAVSTAAPLVDELETILSSLPTEVPPGSEDIYGLDTSIMYGSDKLEWMNGGPQGCGGGTSEVQATEEQKAQFKRAVEIVSKLVEEAQ